MPLVLAKPHLRPLSRLSQRTISDHRVFEVHEGTWQRRDGTSIGPFATFHCPDWCNVVAITPALELVLVWQHRFGTDALSLEVPGGVIETGEAPDRAARRELREETGYEPRTLEPLIRVHPNPPLQSNVCYSFLAEGAHPNGPPAFDANEECELSLVPLASLRELLTEGHVTHALSVVALQALALRGI